MILHKINKKYLLSIMLISTLFGFSLNIDIYGMRTSQEREQHPTALVYENNIIWDGPEVIDPNESVSYAVMIYPDKAHENNALTALQAKLNKIYSDALGKDAFKFENTGKFWQIPHVTAIIFTAKRNQLEKIKTLTEHLKQVLTNGFITFTPESYEFFGTWFVTKPNKNIADKVKHINGIVAQWLAKNIPDAVIGEWSKPQTLIPHMSLNTTVPESVQPIIKDAVAKNMKDYQLDLNRIVITAMKP